MKIGYFITARLKSSRLKQKIVLPLNGQTVLDKVILNCKSTTGIDNVVLCTSTNPQDASLFDYAIKHKIKFYAGSEDDVLKRLLDAAKYYGIDAFLSITADNPLHSVYISNIIIDWVKKQPSDFVFTSGLPIGLTPYFISTKALEVAVAMKEQSDTEIWGPFVNRPDFFKVGYLNVNTNLFSERTRLTCDYLEDYQYINQIYNQFPLKYNPSIFEISAVLNTNNIQTTNKLIEQQTIAPETIQDIKNTFDININQGKEVAKQIGYSVDPQTNNIEIKL